MDMHEIAKSAAAKGLNLGKPKKRSRRWLDSFNEDPSGTKHDYFTGNPAEAPSDMPQMKRIMEEGGLRVKDIPDSVYKEMLRRMRA